MALNVQKLQVRSLDVDFNEVSWELESTSEDIFDYTFQLLRSEGAEGPYDVLTPEMEDQYLFIDRTIRRGHGYRQYFYKLRIKYKADGTTQDFGPSSFGIDTDLIGNEIRRHVLLLMREFAGIRCWVLPIRTFGQRCTCWNAVLNKKTRSGCISCFDTGFVRGYMHPIETWIQIDPTSKNEQNSSVGPQQQANTTGRFGYYPEVKPRDLIIDGLNRRWRITQVSSTQKHTSPIHQEVQLHMVPPTDIEYKIELDLGNALRNIWLAPSRNYTNPQNLENYKDEEIPNIFGIYPPP